MGFFDLNQLLSTSGMKRVFEKIRDEAVEELKQSIQENFYNTYQPTTYRRTMQFLNAVRGEIEISSNSVEIKIFLDPDLMEHPSVVDGLNSYIPPLLYYGHHQQGYDKVDYFHNYPARTEWLDEALNNIKIKVASQIKDAVVTAFKSTKYR